MERVRGFEVAKGFENSDIHMPVRKTKYSAGYDVEAAEDVVVPAFKPGQAPTLIKTGIKAYMPDDEFLMLCNRKSKKDQLQFLKEIKTNSCKNLID